MPKPQVANRHPVACHAPPLTDELLAKYQAIGDALPSGSELKDAFARCYLCVVAWWAIPASTERPTRWTSRRPDGSPVHFDETPLEEKQVAFLDATTPWPSECQLYGQLFDALPNGTAEEKELRNAAFHLLWHAQEITLDREPLTSDVLRT